MWFRNRLVNPVVRLLLRNLPADPGPAAPARRDLNGTATASSDPEAVAAGLRRYLARYPKTARPLGVRLGANGAVTASRPLVVVTVHLDRS
jgi:hypothetical protein